MADDNMDRWLKNGVDLEWEMPAAPLWKRLPIVRHLRAMRLKIQIERWYAFGPGSIGIRTGYDDWVIYGIWKGMERTP